MKPIRKHKKIKKKDWFETLSKLVYISFIPFMVLILGNQGKANAKIERVETLLSQHKEISEKMGRIHHTNGIVKCNNCHNKGE